MSITIQISDKDANTFGGASAALFIRLAEIAEALGLIQGKIDPVVDLNDIVKAAEALAKDRDNLEKYVKDRQEWVSRRGASLSRLMDVLYSGTAWHSRPDYDREFDKVLGKVKELIAERDNAKELADSFRSGYSYGAIYREALRDVQHNIDQLMQASVR